jgi:hypothetical protein
MYDVYDIIFTFFWLFVFWHGLAACAQLAS